MDNQNKNINFFRQAAPYIKKYRKKTFVITLEGNALAHSHFCQIIQEIAILSALGVRIILVHGIRNQVDQQLKELNYPLNIQQTLRVTDNVIMQAVKVAVGQVRITLENTFTHILNMPPIINEGLGLISGNFITAKPLGVINGIDFQQTGKVRKINVKLIRSLLKQDSVVLLSPIGYSPTGKAYNLSYKEIAIETAKAIKADKLIFIHNTTYHSPTAIDLKQMSQPHQHSKNSLFLNDIRIALDKGVERIHFLDINHSNCLLLELYTRDGVGQMFTASRYESIRQATHTDLNGIQKLIHPLEEKGMLVKRSRKQLELEIKHFIVIERENIIIGCAACYPIKESTIGELACLAVHPDYRSQHYGDKLLKYIQQRALSQQLKQLLVLTTHTADWFIERGFTMGSINELPEAKKAHYNYQRKSIILIKPLV